MDESAKPLLLMILGASGTGKSTIIRRLHGRIDHCIMIDADVFWRAEFNTPETGFIEFKRYCLGIASHISQNRHTVVYFLQGMPEDFEKSPERSLFSLIHYLFLISDRNELENRLRSKPKGWGLLEQNPGHLEDLLQYNDNLRERGRSEGIPMVDTSTSTIEEATEQVFRWISSTLKSSQN